MTTAEKRSRNRHKRLERLAARVKIDGRLISPIAPRHGEVGIYITYGCRCRECTGANTLAVKVRRYRRYDERVIVNGELIHPDAPHGLISAYTTWGCRCWRCCDASTAARNRR